MNDENSDRYPDWEMLAGWVAVVEAGSISGAAKLLGITQSGLSQRIKAIELLLNAELLDRTTRPAYPTSAGHRLYEHAKTILQNADQMMEGVRSLTHDRRAAVRLGCVDSFAATLGPTIVRALTGSSTQIRLWSGITPALDEQLEARQLDIAVTTAPDTRVPGIDRRALFSEPYFVVVPKEARLSRAGSLAELGRKLRFIRYSARSVIGRHVDTYLKAQGDEIERTFEFDATDPILSLVAAGLGFALTTPLCIWQSRHFAPEIRVVPLSQFSRRGQPYEKLARTFYIAAREHELGNLPSELRQLLRQVYEKQVSRDIAKALTLRREDIYALAD